MKPKTEFQKIIVELSKKLKPISAKQEAWAQNACLDNYAVICRKTTYCLECGGSWKEDIELAHLLGKCTCPHCAAELKYHDNHRIDKESAYFAILTTKKGMQVVRMFFITKYYKKKSSSNYSINEVMQHYIAPDGKMESLLKPINGLSYYYDAWCSGELEIRGKSEGQQRRCAIGPYKIYPGRNILPILKRNGFKGYFKGITPQEMFSLILSNSVAETLLKTEQYSLLKEIKYNEDRIEKYWNSIKICIRSNYVVKDASIWFDYLSLLEYFGKDLRNAKYVCPENLKKQHDTLYRKKEKLINDKKNREYQSKYKSEKGVFFGLEFQESNISISTLKSIEEFQQEARSLKHCLYSNEYYKRKNSLIMSAKVEGKSVETIEINLPKLDVAQSRGYNNLPSKYHDTIVSLVKRNMKKIEEISSRREAV